MPSITDDNIKHQGASTTNNRSEQDYTRTNRPPISPANEPLMTQLSVYLASPKLQIAYGKVHVEYQTRLLRISRTEIDSQIQQWRDSSNRTVLDQLHSLTANEQQALDAINCGHNSKGLLAAGTLEWIQFGEYLPVNGVEHIMARSITIIISSKDQYSTEKEKPEPIREEEDARYGKESNTWVKVFSKVYLHPSECF